MMTRDMYLHMHYIFVKICKMRVSQFSWIEVCFLLFCCFLGYFVFAYSWGCVNLGVRRFLVSLKNLTFLRFLTSRMLILGRVPNANITKIEAPWILMILQFTITPKANKRIVFTTYWTLKKNPGWFIQQMKVCKIEKIFICNKFCKSETSDALKRHNSIISQSL